MQTQRALRKLSGIVLAFGLCVAVPASAGAAGERAADHVLRLTGQPVMIDSNGRVDGKEQFTVAVLVENSFTTATNTGVIFEVRQGGKVVATASKALVIRPGGGVISTFINVPPSKQKNSLQARIYGFKEDDTEAIRLPRILGAPKLSRNPCSVSVRIKAAPHDQFLQKVYVVGLRKGRIVTVDDTEARTQIPDPGATFSLTDDYFTCVKFDRLLAFIEDEDELNAP